MEIFELINGAVLNSKVFEDLGSEPTDLQNFIHYTLRMELNSIGIAQYSGGEDGLRKMFADGWTIAGGSDFDEILRSSRYHAIGDVMTLSNGKDYNPKFNIKVLSKDKTFERIYNTELGMFLDEIYLEFPEDFNNNGIGISSNIETYNYGYPNNHGPVDVRPYNAFGTKPGDDTELKDDELKKFTRDSETPYSDYINDINLYESMVDAAELVVVINKDIGGK